MEVNDCEIKIISCIYCNAIVHKMMVLSLIIQNFAFFIISIIYTSIGAYTKLYEFDTQRIFPLLYNRFVYAGIFVCHAIKGAYLRIAVYTKLST